MRPSDFQRARFEISREPYELAKRGSVLVCIGLLGWVSGAEPSHAQTSSAAQPSSTTPTSQTRPSSREEIADDEPLSWTLKKFPTQKYMNEIYWKHSSDTPAFFRDSMLQFVTRSYYLTRDNFDGSKSQAWAGGGWVAFRSGLIADTFGVHAAYYTSQNLFGPEDESGTKLLNPDQNALGMLGQLYGRVQVRDQSFAVVANSWIRLSLTRKTIVWCPTRLKALLSSRFLIRIATTTTRLGTFGA